MDGLRRTSDGRADRCAVFWVDKLWLLRESSVFAAFVWMRYFQEETMEEYKKVTISFTKRALKDSREKTGSRAERRCRRLRHWWRWIFRVVYVNSEISTLFRRISPCVRFVEDRRESTVKTICAFFKRLSQLVSGSLLWNAAECSKMSLSILQNYSNLQI